ALAHLVALGAPLTTPTWSHDHSTLLHVARGPVLEELCRVVPSLQIRDGKGATPLQAALDYRNYESAAILLTHGARLEDASSSAPPRLWALEKAILRCRSSTAAF